VERLEKCVLSLSNLHLRAVVAFCVTRARVRLPHPVEMIALEPVLAAGVGFTIAARVSLAWSHATVAAQTHSRLPSMRRHPRIDYKIYWHMPDLRRSGG
jgi:hypothetical protein